jgi:hypothetical protein
MFFPDDGATVTQGIIQCPYCDVLLLSITSKYRLVQRKIRWEYLQNFRKFDNSHVILYPEGSTIYTDYKESKVAGIAQSV